MEPIRRERPGYGILWSEISMDEHDSGGTGQFVLSVEPKALPGRGHVATVAHSGQLRIAIGIHAVKHEVVVFLGGAKYGSLSLRRVYRLPESLPDNPTHHFQIKFDDWQISGVQVDGNTLPEEIQMDA